MKRWSRLAGILILTVVAVEGLDLAVKNAPLPAPASRFLHYYEVLEEAGESDLLQRVLYSWMMAGNRS